MHSGHYNAIRQAKSICDVLVVPWIVGKDSSQQCEKDD